MAIALKAQQLMMVAPQIPAAALVIPVVFKAQEMAVVLPAKNVLTLILSANTTPQEQTTDAADTIVTDKQ